MNKYIKPEFNFTQFSVKDVITQSGVVVNADNLVGADRDMYEVYIQNSAVKSENVSVFTW